MNRTGSLVAGLVAVAALLGAQTISVDYLFGQVETLRGGQWEPLSAGSSVDVEATLRLGRGAVVDLSSGGARFTLAASGSYAVGDLLERRARARRDFGAFLVSALREMLSPPRDEGTPGGVRAGVREPKAMASIEEEQTALDDARRLLRAGRPQEARQLLLRARVPGGDTRSFDFLIAYCEAVQGRTGPALSFLRAARIDSEEAFALRAQLALEAGSHEEALDAARACLAGYPLGAQAQGCSLIEGLALRALGRDGEALGALERAAAMDRDTEAGRLAAQQLLR